MNKIVLSAVLMFGVNLALAAGGQVKDQNPLYDASGNLIGTVVPVPDACEVVIPQSGKAVYIICNDSGD